MTFGSKVHYIAWLMLVEQLTQRWPIANVDMREAVAGMARGLGDGIEAGGIGELVDIDHGGSRIVEQMTNDGRADKAGGEEDPPHPLGAYGASKLAGPQNFG